MKDNEQVPPAVEPQPQTIDLVALDLLSSCAHCGHSLDTHVCDQGPCRQCDCGCFARKASVHAPPVESSQGVTGEEIAELRRLEKWASSAPWYIKKVGHGMNRLTAQAIVSSDTDPIEWDDTDYEFVVALRNLAPRLLSSLESQSRRIAELEGDLMYCIIMAENCFHDGGKLLPNLKAAVIPRLQNIAAMRAFCTGTGKTQADIDSLEKK